MPHANNIDAAEHAKFSALAARWWDPRSEFRPLHEINPARLAWIDRLTPLAGKRVLDTGCGGGILAEAMALRGAQVHGIDITEKALAVARLHAAQSKASVTYETLTTEALALRESARYDVVTCMEMLEHVPDPAPVVAACARLVKPGGWVFFSTINRNPVSYLTAILGGEYIMRMLPRGTHTYARFIKPRELQQMAASHGLTLHQARGLGYNPFTHRFWLHRQLTVGYLLACVRPSP